MAVGTCYDLITSHKVSGGYYGLDLSQISVVIVSYSYGAFAMTNGYMRPRWCYLNEYHRKSCFFIDRSCALWFGSLLS